MDELKVQLATLAEYLKIYEKVRKNACKTYKLIELFKNI